MSSKYPAFPLKAQMEAEVGLVAGSFSTLLYPKKEPSGSAHLLLSHMFHFSTLEPVKMWDTVSGCGTGGQKVRWDTWFKENHLF